MNYRVKLIKCLFDQNIKILDTDQFIVNIVWEKNENHIDDIIYMYRYDVFNQKIKGEKFSLNIVLDILNCIDNYYPLWIHVSKLEENLFLIEYTSRYREVGDLHYQDSGNPPFKYIDTPPR